MEELFRALGLSPCELSLYTRALTHRSALNESKQTIENNETMEFLGDAILGAAVSEHLYRSHPNLNEGQLARRKSALVSEPVLAGWATHYGLGRYLVLGKGEEHSGGREKSALLADAFEAMLGAVFLDLGWDCARALVIRSLESISLPADVQKKLDAKSLLQEYTQRFYKRPPQYRLLRTQGPDHAKQFEVEVLVCGRVVARSHGKTKKEAEQEGAARAMQALENQP